MHWHHRLHAEHAGASECSFCRLFSWLEHIHGLCEEQPPPLQPAQLAEAHSGVKLLIATGFVAHPFRRHFSDLFCPVLKLRRKQ